MTTDFDIEGVILRVDTRETERRYLPEITITEQCACEDCVYYQNNVLNRPFEIFKKLREMGVDLGKNLRSEPTGVWCVCYKGELVHFFQVYRVVGVIVDAEQITHVSIDKDYKLEARFIPFESDCVDIELNYQRIADHLTSPA